jgi:hypothetical protein
MRTIKLCHGEGNGVDTACLMNAISIITGENSGDRPDCVCPVIRSFCVVLNDMMSDDARSRLLTPLIWELPGTRVDDDDVMNARVNVFLDCASHYNTACHSSAFHYTGSTPAYYAARAANAIHMATQKLPLEESEKLLLAAVAAVRAAAAIGDKRPVEVVVSRERLEKQLGVL